MERVVTIQNINGDIFDAKLILCFEVPEIEEKYIIYTLPNESIINIGNVYDKDGIYYIKNIDNDAEWTFVKKVMAQIVRED